MRENHEDDAFFGASRSEAPGLLLLPTDDDAGLLALEAEFNRLVAELVAARNASAAAVGSARRSLVDVSSDADQENDVRKAEAILARLYPIEQAIMTTPARTIAGLGVKARHAVYVVSQYWDAPINQIDWDARTIRLLIESVCNFTGTPVPHQRK
jgi:hypothetical protein